LIARDAPRALHASAHHGAPRLHTGALDARDVPRVLRRCRAHAPFRAPLAQPLIHLKKNAIGDFGANALGRAISAGRLPIRALRMQSNHVCAEGAQSIVEGLMLGSSPIEEISFIDNPICLSSSVVRKQKLE